MTAPTHARPSISSPPDVSPVTLDDVERAADRLAGVVAHTPLELNERLSERFGARIYLKREDLQAVRSYKIRGAYNRMSVLSASDRQRGAVCASAGNHAQGFAFTCNRLGVQGRVYMPRNTPRQKVDRVRRLGGPYIAIELVGETFDEAQALALREADERGMVFVHPFDDPHVIAGQGTVGLEVWRDADVSPDVVVAPVGGGGLLAGLSVVHAGLRAKGSLVGVEPAGAASMQAALDAGGPVALPRIDTFVDGAAVTQVGALTHAICARFGPTVLQVPEGAVCTEMISLYQSEGIIAEPAGALSIAALPLLGEAIRGRTVVCVVSGGNNDISRYPEIIERSLIDRGLKQYFLIEFSQRPGALRRYLDEALGADDDITHFEYIKKSNREFGPALVGIELARADDLQPLLERMAGIGLRFESITPDSALFRFVI